MIPDFLRRENANKISELDKRITEAMVRYHKQFPADGLMTESWSWPCEAWPDIIERCIIQNKTIWELFDEAYDPEADY